MEFKRDLGLYPLPKPFIDVTKTKAKLWFHIFEWKKNSFLLSVESQEEGHCISNCDSTFLTSRKLRIVPRFLLSFGMSIHVTWLSSVSKRRKRVNSLRSFSIAGRAWKVFLNDRRLQGPQLLNNFFPSWILWALLLWVLRLVIRFERRKAVVFVRIYLDREPRSRARLRNEIQILAYNWESIRNIHAHTHTLSNYALLECCIFSRYQVPMKSIYGFTNVSKMTRIIWSFCETLKWPMFWNLTQKEKFTVNLANFEVR